MSQQKPLQYVLKDLEPRYIATDDDFTGPHGQASLDPRFNLRPDFIAKTAGVPAARGHWQCPYCELNFARKKPCLMHMGLMPNFPAHCKVLLARDEARRHGSNWQVEMLITQYAEAIEEADRRSEVDGKMGGKLKNNQSPAKASGDMRIGTLCERAYFAHENIPWALACRSLAELRRIYGGKKPADYGDHEVRGMAKGGSHLAVQHEREDPPEYKYILAAAAECDLVVDFCGWAPGSEVQKPEYWNKQPDPKRPCYWFPMSKLHPMSTLPLARKPDPA